MSDSGESRGQGGHGDRVFSYTGQATSEIPRDVTRVRVDPSVKTIGEIAFLFFDRLEELELCDGLEEIGEYAFGGLYDRCASLRRIRIPPTVQKIGKGSFKECEQLEEVELCKGVGEVGEYAFNGCKSLKRIGIPSTVKKIGKGAFKECEQLEEVELCEGAREVGEHAFSGCKSLKHIIIPSTVKKIRKGAFQDCKQLEEAELCGGVEEVGEHAFNWCKSLKHIIIPSTIQKIDKNAFQGCEQLEEVELCEGLKEIGDYAFGRCESLERVRIPSTVKKIGSGAFEGCDQLEELELCDGIGEIGGRAFRGCKSLKCVRIPSTIRKKIGGLAFGDCEQLEEVELCEGLKNMGKGVFARCKSLRFIIFPSTLKVIMQGTFQSCHQLEKVDFREGLEGIGKSAFENCISLQHISIPSTVKLIGKKAFSGCTQLVSVELDDAHQKIEDLVFKNCLSLRNILLPSTVKNDALQGCHDIQKLFGTQNESANALKCRFDGLPIHQLCYYQSSRSAQEIFEQLQNIFGMMSDQVRASMPAESSPMQKNGIGKRAATQSEGGPKTKVRCYGVASSDAASERLLSSGTTFSPFNMLHCRIDCSQDCLGMTPLHILACSTKVNLDLYQFIVASQPTCLITKDKWGCLPIFYAIWGNCLPEIVQFLIDSQIATFPNIELDWDRMVATICRAGTSLDVVQKLLKIKQLFFSQQSIDWQRAAQELTICCLVGCDSFDEDFPSKWEFMMEFLSDGHAYQALIESLMEIQQTFFPDHSTTIWQAVCEEFVQPLKGWWQPGFESISSSVFQFLIRFSIPSRMKAIGVRKWQMDIKYLVERVPYSICSYLDTVHSKLVFYECEYNQMKDATFLLELALWRFKIDDFTAIEQNIICPHKELGAPAPDMKTYCRVNCGAEIIIPNFLPYLVLDVEKDNGSSALT